jgi:hypothetical protein
MTAIATQPVVPSKPQPSLSFGASQSERREFASKLKQQTLAVRVRHEKLGVRKALTREQLKRAAEEFDADSKVLSAAKKLIDTRDPTYRAVVNVRTRATAYWRSVTTPYPESGVRLIRKQRVQEFESHMSSLRSELNQAVAALQEKYAELQERARVQLGTLFNEDDYPPRVDGEFDLDWDYPPVDPPSILKDLHPQLYEQEVERVRGRFEEAVALAEQAFVQQFHELVAHLAERLKGDVDGKPKVFRDTAIEKLNGFFEQFRELDIGSNAELQELVDKAQNVVKGVNAGELRENTDVRNAVASQLAEIQQAMDGLMVNKPKRAISLEDE